MFFNQFGRGFYRWNFDNCGDTAPLRMVLFISQVVARFLTIHWKALIIQMTTQAICTAFTRSLFQGAWHWKSPIKIFFWSIQMFLLGNGNLRNILYWLSITSGAPNVNFGKNICSEDDLKSIIFLTFVLKFLAYLPLLGFFRTTKKWYNCPFLTDFYPKKIT